MGRKDWREAKFLELSREAGCIWQRPNGNHYKNGRLNYYPSTGTFTIDGGTSGRCSPEIAVELAMREQIPRPQKSGEERGPDIIWLADLCCPEVDRSSEDRD